MKFSYDPQADALSLRLTDARIEDTDEVQPGIIVDYDEAGQVVAVEMLNVRKRSQPVEVALQNQTSVARVGRREAEAVNYVTGSASSAHSTAWGGAAEMKSAAEKTVDTSAEARVPVEQTVPA